MKGWWRYNVVDARETDERSCQLRVTLTKPLFQHSCWLNKTKMQLPSCSSFTLVMLQVLIANQNFCSNKVQRWLRGVKTAPPEKMETFTGAVGLVPLKQTRRNQLYHRAPLSCKALFFCSVNMRLSSCDDESQMMPNYISLLIFHGTFFELHITASIALVTDTSTVPSDHQCYWSKERSIQYRAIST